MGSSPMVGTAGRTQHPRGSRGERSGGGPNQRRPPRLTKLTGAFLSARRGTPRAHPERHPSHAQGRNTALPPAPPRTRGAFMDDTYLWGENPEHLQHTLTLLEANLHRHGLRINPKKTHIITNNPASTVTFTVANQTVTPDKGDTPRTPLRVLGSPISFRGTTPQLAAEMGSRARTAFAQNKQVLSAPTPAKPRVRLHDSLVRQSALYGCETWPPQDTLLRAANTQQLSQLRSMTGGAMARMEQQNTQTRKSTSTQNQGGEMVYIHPPAYLEALGARDSGRRGHQRHPTLERPGLLEKGTAKAPHARSTPCSKIL